MDVRASHLAVIVPAGPSREQAVAKVDQTAQGDEGEEDCLFQTNRMGAVGLFFEEAALSNLGAGGHVRLIEEYGRGEKSSSEFHSPAELAIIHGDRRLRAQFRPRRNQGFGAGELSPPGEDDPFAGYASRVDLFADIDGEGGGDADPLFQEAQNRQWQRYFGPVIHSSLLMPLPFPALGASHGRTGLPPSFIPDCCRYRI